MHKNANSLNLTEINSAEFNLEARKGSRQKIGFVLQRNFKCFLAGAQQTLYNLNVFFFLSFYKSQIQSSRIAGLIQSMDHCISDLESTELSTEKQFQSKSISTRKSPFIKCLELFLISIILRLPESIGQLQKPFFAVLGIKHRALSMLGKYSTTKL